MDRNPTRPGLVLILACAAAGAGAVVPPGSVQAPVEAHVPRHYLAQRAATPLVLDGRLDEADWRRAPWTTDFIDIEGDARPRPRHRTRAKMLWDDEFFYVAAELDEPHLWATLTERDSVVYYDNDFELFLDPDGDTHDYYELEINALGTEWDLMLTRPYRDGGRAIDAWDVAGLDVGIELRGTLNDPADLDDGWTLEIAMPWSVLEEAALHAGPPEDGEIWRVNFSRVQWRLESADGAYSKLLVPATGEPLPEDNWVWSPQHAINMHRPEHWGFVQFSDTPAGAEAQFTPDPDQPVRAALRELYYRQRAFHERTGRWADTLGELGAGIELEGTDFVPRLERFSEGWLISAVGVEAERLFIRHDGKAWSRR